ncbi:MAG TPA: DinB family protein [Terracidiphilus sp.]|jgi:uncharacterized damage-inducible protein DinB|nr:DinB family protein [Terracidiphilus sp.]
MTAGLTFVELLGWDQETSSFWKSHLSENPHLLELPCSIGGAESVQALVRHIWGAQLRWAERLAGLPETPKEAVPDGPLDVLYAVHVRAAAIYRDLLAGPEASWDGDYTLHVHWIPGGQVTLSRRKVMGHALLHSQRHWAQLATLLRVAGYPSEFRGDLLFSSSLR